MEIDGFYTLFVDHLLYCVQFFLKLWLLKQQVISGTVFLCCALLLLELKGNLCTLSSSSSGSFGNWFIRISLTELDVPAAVLEDYFFCKT